MPYRAVFTLIGPGRGQKRVIFEPGDLLPDDLPNIKDHVASGFAEEVSNAGLIIAKEVPPVTPGKAIPKWMFHPRDLEKRSLSALKALIAEKDPKAPVPSSKAEAIRWLSQDLKQ